MTTRNSTVEAVRQYIYRQFPLAKKQNVQDGDPLLDSGVVDSLGILEIVGFLEEEFKIVISDEELLPENFGTIDALASFVERKGEGG